MIDATSLDTTVVILSGGRARRLGQPKSVVNLDGRSALRVLLDALPDDLPVVVVGDSAPDVERQLRILREDPPFAGPLHAVSTAVIQLVTTGSFIVQAVDQPLAAGHTLQLVPQLGSRVASAPAQAVIPVDPSGRQQPLAAAYDTHAVRDAIARLGTTVNQPMSALLRQLVVLDLPIRPDDAMLADYLDIDTPADLELTRMRLPRTRPSTRTPSPAEPMHPDQA